MLLAIQSSVVITVQQLYLFYWFLINFVILKGEKKYTSPNTSD